MNGAINILAEASLSKEEELLLPIIGGLLADSSYDIERLGILPSSIANNEIRVILNGIIYAHTNGFGRDILQIVAYCKERGVEQKFILDIMDKYFVTSNIPTYIKRYNEYLVRQKLSKIGNDIMVKSSGIITNGEVIEYANNLLSTISNSGAGYSVGENVDNLFNYIEERKGKELFGYSFGKEFSFLDKATRGIQAGRTYRVGALSNVGKAMPLYEKIYTPTGFTTFKDVNVGDDICNSYGGISKVIGVFPQGKKKIYRIEFSDGTHVDSCENHLWAVYSNTFGHKNYKVMEVNSLIKNGIKTNYGNRYFIPLPAPMQFVKSNELTINPYVMGIMIAEANFGKYHIQISNTNPIVKTKVASLLPPTDSISDYKNNNITYGIVGGGLLKSIKDYGLKLHRSYEKFIPTDFIRSSIEDRKELLAGLIDGDGWMSGSSYVYTTTSKQLSEDVQEVARSLGGLVKITTHHKTYDYKGEKKLGRLSYDVRISLPFILNTSVEYKKPKERKRKLVKSIIGINYIGDMECKCIAVDAIDNLYITSGHVLTHNTQWVYGIINNIIDQGAKVAFFSLENDKDMTLSNILANRQGINSWDLEAGKVEVNLEKLGELDNKLFVIDDCHELSEILSTILTIKPDVVVLDYIGLVSINKVKEDELFTEYAKRVQQFVKKTRVGWIDLSNLPIGVEDDAIIHRGQFYGSSYLKNNADVGFHIIKFDEFYKYKAQLEQEQSHRQKMVDDVAYRMNWVSKKGVKIAITKNRIGPAGMQEDYIVNFMEGGRFSPLTQAQKDIFYI